jgi:5-methylcytosine-specific restriction endonuclease McrA
MKNKVLVLSKSYEPLSITSFRKAFLLVYMEKAEVVDSSDVIVRSPSKSFNAPSIIRLKTRPRYNLFSKVELNRKNILKRDNHQCQYCGACDNLTVDHIIPKSKGGASTWDNLVTACSSCNNKKDNKSLKEVGMHLKTEPKRPNYVHFLTRKHTIHESWKPYLFLH